MRTLFVIAAALVLAAGVGALASSGEGANRSTLRLVDKQPLKFKGISFRAGEVVRVRAATDTATQVRRTTAGPAGTFVVTFNHVAFDPCSLEVEASGNRGDRASYRVSERMCLMERMP